LWRPLSIEEVAVKKARELAFPHLRVAEAEGACCGRIDFQRYLLPADRHIARFKGRMDFDTAPQAPLG